MYGLPTDTIRREFRTRVVPNNGLNPVYNETLTVSAHCVSQSGSSPVSQAVHQSVSHSGSSPVNKSVRQFANQTVSQAVCQSVSQMVHQ